MTSKANGRWVSIIAAGIWICLSGPSLAARDGEAQTAKIEGTASAGKPIALRKYAKHSRYWKKHASQRKLGKTAGRSHRKEIATIDVATVDEGTTAPALPENVANANAELLSAEKPADTTDAGLVSADQLNDVDRTLSENHAPAPLVTQAAANIPDRATPATVSNAVSSEDTAWSKSSIIGKIFIAFGGLLTLASAARMFMA